MKTLPKFNLRLICLLLATASVIVSCSKESEPEPSMGDQMTGTYVLTKVTIGTSSGTFPSTNATTGVVTTGKITVTKVADDKVTGTLTTTETDKAGKATNSTSSFGEILLKKSSTGTIEGYQGTVQVSTYSNSELSIFSKLSTGETITVVGKK